MTENTFADKILNEPCDHEWELESSNWVGRNYKCIYCEEENYKKNEVTMMDC